jgi:hypothetical protein
MLSWTDIVIDLWECGSMVKYRGVCPVPQISVDDPEQGNSYTGEVRDTKRFTLVWSQSRPRRSNILLGAPCSNDPAKQGLATLI